MPDFERLAAQTSACAARWEDARERYAAASADWAKALHDFADHLEGSDDGDMVPTLRGFAISLEAGIAEAPDVALPELLSPSREDAASRSRTPPA